MNGLSYITKKVTTYQINFFSKINAVQRCIYLGVARQLLFCVALRNLSLSSFTAPSKWCGFGQHVKSTIRKKLHKGQRNRPVVLRQDSQKLPHDTSSSCHFVDKEVWEM